MEKIAALSKERHLDLNRYSQLFEAKGNLISGDITPTYASLNDEIIDRIAVHLPHLKVIFLARDPVERAWSQLSMALRHQDIPNFGPNDAEQIMHSLLSPGVILQSYPSKIVARWKRHIPAESFRLYFYDDLQSNPADLRRSILEFLGGDPDKPSGNLRPEYNSHAAFAKVPLTPPMRARIAEFFQRELKASAQELGGAAAHWPAKYGFALCSLGDQFPPNRSSARSRWRCIRRKAASLITC